MFTERYTGPVLPYPCPILQIVEKSRLASAGRLSFYPNNYLRVVEGADPYILRGILPTGGRLAKRGTAHVIFLQKND